MRTERSTNGSVRALVVILLLLLAEAIFAPSPARRTSLNQLSVASKPRAIESGNLPGDNAKPKE